MSLLEDNARTPLNLGRLRALERTEYSRRRWAGIFSSLACFKSEFSGEQRVRVA